MIDPDNLLWMFKQVHDDVDDESSSCYTEVVGDDEHARVHLMKDGYSCWSEGVSEIHFNYTMRNIKGVV